MMDHFQRTRTQTSPSASGSPVVHHVHTTSLPSHARAQIAQYRPSHGINSQMAVVLTPSQPKRNTHDLIGAQRDETAQSNLNSPSSIMKSGTPEVLGSISKPIIVSSAGRGRPKGWKMGMSYSAMRGKDQSPPNRKSASAGVRQSRASQPQYHFTKRGPGRPSKIPSPPPSEVYRRLEPEFPRFLCEWSDCRAELHNLNALKRHISVVHGGKSARNCHWASCGRNKPTRLFPTEHMRNEHLEQEHIIPLSWHVGDGPSNSWNWTRTKVEDVPDFLKDTSGIQITPSTKHQELEDFATYKHNRRKLQELLIRRDENLPSDDSEDSEQEI